MYGREDRTRRSAQVKVSGGLMRDVPSVIAERSEKRSLSRTVPTPSTATPANDDHQPGKRALGRFERLWQCGEEGNSGERKDAEHCGSIVRDPDRDEADCADREARIFAELARIDRDEEACRCDQREELLVIIAADVAQRAIGFPRFRHPEHDRRDLIGEGLDEHEQ